VEQKYYEKEFSRLLQYLQEAPRTLARVRFLMGSPMQGGGKVHLCQVVSGLVTLLLILLYAAGAGSIGVDK
jgi:hypothetical protein